MTDLPSKILSLARELEIEPKDLDRKTYRKHGPGGKDKGFSEARLKAQVAYVNSVGTPEGMYLQASTVHLDGEGNLKQLWAKPRKGAAQEKAVEYLLKLAAQIPALPLTPIERKPPASATDLAAIYALGDSHIGKYASALIGGVQWDRAKAVALTKEALDDLVVNGTPTSHGVLADVGDYLHACNPAGTTVKGTTLDVDGIFHEALIDAHELKKHMVRRMLQHHDHVTVISKQGNHEGSIQFILSMALYEAFCDDPRVTVELNAEAVSLFHWGKCLIPIMHGDKKKDRDVSSMLMSDPRKRTSLAEAKLIHAFIGHLHHVDKVKEDGGVIREYVQCLAPADVWHHDHHFISDRSMSRIVFCRSGREISRRKFTV